MFTCPWHNIPDYKSQVNRVFFKIMHARQLLHACSMQNDDDPDKVGALQDLVIAPKMIIKYGKISHTH